MSPLNLPFSHRLAALAPWADAARACPLADVRRAFRLLARRKGAAVWASAGTLALFLANSNAADLWGRRIHGGWCPRALNEALAGDGLPPARACDMPDGLVAVGPREGPCVLLDVGDAGDAG